MDYDNYISPCINQCHIDPDRKLCTGCKRTIMEIRNWNKFPKELKLIIMDKLDDR